MTLSVQFSNLEKLLKSNPHAHCLYMSICKDCDEEGYVQYSYKDLKYLGRTRKMILDELDDLTCFALLDFHDDGKVIHIKLTPE
jgi:hypothetical protein